MSSWTRDQRAVALRDAEARRRSLIAAMESGSIPSALLGAERVRVLQHQIHPVAGERLQVHDGACAFWVAASDVSDVRGTPPESVVPAGLARSLGWIAP